MTVWRDQGAAAARLDSTSYLFGDLINDGTDNVWVVVVPGLSDVAPPTFDPMIGTANDNEIVWELVPYWATAATPTSGDLTQPTTPNGHSYDALGSGVNGATEPGAWPTDGTNVDDGGTGGDGGELIPPDPDDNDGGNGTESSLARSPLIFQLWEDPRIDRAAGPIGVLDRLEHKQVRPVRNDSGDGELVINANEEQAEWLLPGRIVVAYRGTIDSPPRFAWSLERKSKVPVSVDEEGGERIQWTGRGVLALLRHAIVWPASVLPNAGDLGASPQDRRDGQWGWTDRPAAAIFIRMFEEAQYRGTEFGTGLQDSSIPNMYVTFKRGVDSLGNPWDNSAGALFRLPILDNLFSDVLPKLIQVGLLIRATPVINSNGKLRIRVDSWTDDPGVDSGITYEKGEDIEDSAEQVIDDPFYPTDVVVEGDIDGDGVFNYRIRSDATWRAAVGRSEFGLPFHATQHSGMLNKAGDRVIREGKKKRSGPTTMQVTEVEGRVAMVDFNEWDLVSVDIPGTWDDVQDNLTEILIVSNAVAEPEVGVHFGDGDSVGIVGVNATGCNDCSEPAGDT